ncbi:ribosome assembly cofactor RimP [Brachyspira hyodysenteriae]|uniref:ribosome assembly cofactor RimP n=1 Tax=Brachyspira hyodysenteriae TaxID=159 RepID=UPI002B25E129|nr:ribosome assembly cofactor RimP [Brachyspira hyodysenteriae]WPC38122.1 ribosome assembly cofactor RimP [Brachyspira hyodysenteriae]
MNNKTRPQKQKEYGREPKKKKLKKDKASNTNKIENNIIDEAVLYNGIKDILEKSNIYLLDLKVRAISDNKKVYAVIFKKKESVSHTHCIETTRKIQDCIKSNGYDEGDYTITVSSAGFRWKFNDRYELFEDMPIKIKYRSGEEFITSYAILKKSEDDYIIITVTDEDNVINEKNIKILKKDIIKARLNC